MFYGVTTKQFSSFYQPFLNAGSTFLEFWVYLCYCSVFIYFNDKINEQTDETYLSCVIQVSRVCSLISPLIFILHYLIVMDYPAVGGLKSLPIDFHIIQKWMEACSSLERKQKYTNNTRYIAHKMLSLSKMRQNKMEKLKRGTHFEFVDGYWTPWDC